MATSLQQLLDSLAANVADAPPTTPIEDVSGALGHLGRALARLAHDGLTQDSGARQRTATWLGDACTAVGALWPATGGTLTDLAGAAADLIGRDRALLGRSHRWAMTVELAERADQCARLGRRLLPRAAVEAFTAIRRLAGAVERDAQTDPPTIAAASAMDRLVPLPAPPTAAGGLTVATETSAALVFALDPRRRPDAPTLREFRAVVAAAVEASRHATAVTIPTVGEADHPWLLTAAAWQAVGRLTMTFEDGRRGAPTDPAGIVRWAHALRDTLAELGPTDDAAIDSTPHAAARVVSAVQQVANQIPVLADQLAAVVAGWARSGQLYAYAKDLPQMEDMPEDRVRAVIAGRRVPALGADLDRLGQAVDRAGVLSTALADALNQAATTAPDGQRNLATLYAQRTQAVGAGARLIEHAQAVERALAAIRTPLNPNGPGLRGPSPHR